MTETQKQILRFLESCIRGKVDRPALIRRVGPVKQDLKFLRGLGYIKIKWPLVSYLGGQTEICLTRKGKNYLNQ